MVEDEEKAIVKDIVPKFEISVSEAGERLKQLNEFINTQMIDKVDYGKIVGIQKPTLFKSGAEKLENIYGLYHEFEQLEAKEDFEKGFFFYRYKCLVFRRKDGIKVSECVGSANNKEKARIGKDSYDVINTIDKMAQKRAFVGAILSACRVSSKFTQDVENVKEVKSNDIAPKCSGCGANISDSVNKFSIEKFNKPLCYSCQQKKDKDNTTDVVM